MSFTSIRCPNCAGSESLPVGENQYRCKFCDNTFHFDNPDTPKITKNITVQESNHCPICGRGVTAGTSNRCTICGTSDFCSNCIFETQDRKISCKNCLKSLSYDCLECGDYAIWRCPACMGRIKNDPILQQAMNDPTWQQCMNDPNYTNQMEILGYCIQRYCSKHILGKIAFDVPGLKYYFTQKCSHCGIVCILCKDSSFFNTKCKNCGNKIKDFTFLKYNDLKKENKTFAEWVELNFNRLT